MYRNHQHTRLEERFILDKQSLSIGNARDNHISMLRSFISDFFITCIYPGILFPKSRRRYFSWI
jgi:hypothetical protein